MMNILYARQLLRPGLYAFQKPSLAIQCSAFLPRTKVSMTGLQRSFSITSIIKQNEASGKRTLPWVVTGATVAGLGLGLASLSRSTVHCDSPPSSPKPSTSNKQPKWTDNNLPPPPTSSVSLYELGFGTVAGVCAGVFVKKGAKMAAWFLGGIFVLLQYLNSASFIRVDWKRISNKFEDLFYSTDAAGSRNPPTLGSVWKSLIDFLTADFQPRASFLAGFMLGLRIG